MCVYICSLEVLLLGKARSPCVPSQGGTHELKLIQKKNGSCLRCFVAIPYTCNTAYDGGVKSWHLFSTWRRNRLVVVISALVYILIYTYIYIYSITMFLASLFFGMLTLFLVQKQLVEKTEEQKNCM